MTDTMDISHTMMRDAKQIANKLPELFKNRNLIPAFTKFFVTTYAKMVLLIAVLDTTKIGDHSRYAHPELLHQLSTDLDGRRVYRSNTTALRFVVALSSLPRLPRSIELPRNIPPGMVALGVRMGDRPVLLPWSRLGHLLVVGMTGSGKSSLLVCLALQAADAGFLLALSDIDQTTFSMLDRHPSLYTSIATSVEQTLEMLQKLLLELNHRAELFKGVAGYPANLDEYNSQANKERKEAIKPIFVILDESSSVLKASGGANGQLASKLAEIGWRGRKFGVSFVFAGQECTKELMGAVREQVNLVVAFRVRPSSAQMAKRIGCEGAERIPANRPGLAISDRFGPLQSYYIPKPRMLSAGSINLSVLSEQEYILFKKALTKAEGRLTLMNIAEWGECSQHHARKMQAMWFLRGWISKDAARDNSFCLTPKAIDMVTNHQTAQTASSQDKPTQTRI